jgi:ubiquitin-activating enzyme E1
MFFFCFFLNHILVDEKLYSRQLYVMGHEAQRRMMSSKVLLLGMSGLGAEVAKNCILAGVHTLVLCDPTPPNSFDLGGNFYLTEGQISSAQRKGRAELCRDKLAELNPHVQVTVPKSVPALMEPHLDAIVKLVPGTACVVVTVPLSTSILCAIDHQCRQSKSCFIYSQTSSVFAQIFCDFGQDFIVSDKDGENPATSQLELVIPTNPVVIKVLEDQGRHGLETGDTVAFSRVSGVPLLNDTQHKIKVTGPFTFELEESDTTKKIAELGKVALPSQGYITQVKQPTTVSFQSYAEALENPKDFMLSDFAKFDRPPILLLAFRALAQYQSKHAGELPPPADKAAALELVSIARSLDKDGILADDGGKIKPELEHLVKSLSYGARAILSPMCAFIGGFVGQEVLKACSGKFMPINGFFMFDALECLPNEDIPEEDVRISYKSRYDSQNVVFGKSMQQAFCNLNYLIVGAGAIGCEMLKNWALMGVGKKARTSSS